MVKIQLKKWFGFSILTLFGLGISFAEVTFAVNFSNRDLDQNKVIAIAQPSSRGNYSLIIIEQVSNQRPCWQEQGNNPVVVQPLLLDFDFTGICERSTDSNGYSIRMGGEDQGQYRLQIVREGNNLKLMGVPSRDRSLPRIEIGQTNGLSEDFSKIILNEGWSFSKRVYEGKTLGHIYLTNETNLNTLIANSPTPRPVSNTNITNNTSSNNTSSNNTSSNNTSSAVIVTTNSEPEEDWIEFSSNSNQNNSNSNLNNNTSNSNQNSNGRSIPDFSSNSSNLPVQPVPQPPPLTSNSGGSNLSPTPLASALGFNYRVIVHTRNTSEENKVKTIVPDAFRTRINNQVVLQAGLFVERATADILQQQFSQQGLNSEVIPVN